MSGEVLKLTEADGGRTVPVPPGAEVELVLPENPTTGCLWHWPETASVVVADQGYRSTSEAVVPGAGALRVLRLRLTGDSAHLHLWRGQEWEPDTAPDASFDITLRRK